MRRQHPAVESAINNLEYRGLERVRSHGAGGLERTVALGIVAAKPASLRAVFGQIMEKWAQSLEIDGCNVQISRKFSFSL